MNPLDTVEPFTFVQTITPVAPRRCAVTTVPRSRAPKRRASAVDWVTAAWAGLLGTLLGSATTLAVVVGALAAA